MKHLWDYIESDRSDEDEFGTYFALFQCRNCKTEITVTRDDFEQGDPYDDEVEEEGLALTCEEQQVKEIMNS